MTENVAPGSAHPARRLQFRLKSIFLVIIAWALLLSLWRLGGNGAVGMPLLIGFFTGVLIAVLLKNKIGLSAFIIVSTATVGAIVGAMLGLYFGGINIEALNAPPGMKTRYEPVLLGRWAFAGAFPAVFVAGVVRWLTKRST